MRAVDELALLKRIVPNAQMQIAKRLIGVVETLRASHDANVSIRIRF